MKSTASTQTLGPGLENGSILSYFLLPLSQESFRLDLFLTSHLCHQTTSVENWAALKCTISTLKCLICLLPQKTETSVCVYRGGDSQDGKLGL